jgi:mRNA interferase MazF
MQRKEIWLINLDPTIGAEIKKTRPAVIISSNDLGTLPLRIIAPITEWKLHYAQVPWMVKVLPNQNTGLTKNSAIDLFQIRSVSISRFIKQVGIIDEKTMQSALEAVKDVIEIPS